jgi:hypothetical protein
MGIVLMFTISLPILGLWMFTFLLQLALILISITVGTNHVQKSLFRQSYPQVHPSATSSDIGLHKDYINKSIVGEAAIISLGLWASKVTHSWSDPSGMGSYSITTITGKHNKMISFISAYIAVKKGSDISVESMFAQQTTLY